MTLDSFFEKFELFAEAPNAVAKMRELILDLAVRGKLVPQHPNDVPAPKTLSIVGIDVNKSCLNSAEQRYPIPDSWCWITFSNVGEQRLGKMLDEQKNRGTSRPYLRNTNVQWMRFNLDDIKEMRIEESERDELRLRKGDLLICEGGEPGRCAIWNDESSEMYFQKALHRVRPCGAVLPEFLVFNLRADCLNGVLERFFTGATIKHLTGRSLGEYPIPIPPLAEQKRIVAKVDELMALCDRLEAQQGERETRHTALVQASLTRFTDAPTPTNLEFLFHKAYSIEPNDLRKIILDLAAQGRLIPASSDSELVSLDSVLAEASVNGVSKGPSLDSSATEILKISAGTSRKDFFVDEDDYKHVELEPSDISKFSLAPGDLLACRFNGNLHYVGRFSYYRGTSGRTQVNPDKLIRFRVNNRRCDARYVCYVLNAPATRLSIESMCATTAGNIGLSAGKLKTVEFPLPPLPEQKRIVAKVEELMGLVDRLEALLSESRERAARLMDAVVAEIARAA